MRKEMRRPITLAITVLCLFVLSPSLARTEAAGNLVSYRLEKAKLAQEEPVLADVSIHNLSSRPIDIDLGGNGNENIKISILRPNGQKMERISQERTNGITFFGKVHLEPNQSYSETLVLNERFEFNEIGNYSIEIGPKTLPASTDVLNLEVGAREPAELGTSCSALLQNSE